ncbi:MAG: hypothetical protein NT018_05785 [Armatimonadetes bacterium]|nr:hypothetical protein [Armatimonadota bacterium]
MLNVSEFSSALHRAVESGDSQLLKVISDDWGDHMMFIPGHLEDSIFQVAIEIMRTPGFQAMDGAQHLLFRFVSDWASLSRDQKRILLPVLEETYPLYASSTACFFISVVLGERYHNSRALDVLMRLSKIGGKMGRSPFLLLRQQ